MDKFHKPSSKEINDVYQSLLKLFNWEIIYAFKKAQYNHGLTVHDLADLSGVSVRTIKKIIRYGNVDLPLKTYARLFCALGIDGIKDIRFYKREVTQKWGL